MTHVPIPEIQRWMEVCVAQKDASEKVASQWHAAACAYVAQDQLQSGTLAIATTAATSALGSIVGEVIAASVFTAISEWAASRYISLGVGKVLTGGVFAAQTLPEINVAAKIIGNVLSCVVLTGAQSGAGWLMTGEMPTLSGTNLFDFLAGFVATSDANELYTGVAGLLVSTVAAQAWSQVEEPGIQPGKPSTADKVIADAFEKARANLLGAIVGGGVDIASGFWAAVATYRPKIADYAGRNTIPPTLALPYGLAYLADRQKELNEAVYAKAYYEAEAVVWARTYMGLSVLYQAVDRAYQLVAGFTSTAFLPAIKEAMGLARSPK